MCQQMHRRGRAFWQWSPWEWREVVGTTYSAFERANDTGPARNGLRPHLLDVAYLLCGFDDFGPLWTATAFYPRARVVFGPARIDSQIARIDAALAQEGYATGHLSMKQRHQAIAFVLLLNRSSMNSPGLRWSARRPWPVLMPRASSFTGSPKPWS